MPIIGLPRPPGKFISAARGAVILFPLARHADFI